MTAPTSSPPKPATPLQLGELARRHREAAGLTRHELSKQTGLSVATIRNFEMGRHKPFAGTLRSLMKAPALANLPELAKQAGLVLDLGEDDTTPVNGGAHG